MLVITRGYKKPFTRLHPRMTEGYAMPSHTNFTNWVNPSSSLEMKSPFFLQQKATNLCFHSKIELFQFISYFITTNDRRDFI
jgi:hypothetical protein